jgi:hypothetical protein
MSKLFNVKTLAFLVVLLALGFGAWKGYDWIYQRGVAAQKVVDGKTIDALNSQIRQDKQDLTAQKALTEAANTKLAAYVKQYDDYVAETKANEAKLQQQQNQVVGKLNGTIAKLQTQLKQAQSDLTHDIATFIPPDGSAACQLPRGLVQIYNASLTGTDTTGGFSTALGLDTNAFDPSGVSCSTFAGYLVDNGLAAYSNRQLLIAWQSWYADNKAIVDAAIKAAQATPTPVAPPKTALRFTATVPASTTAVAPVH